LPQSRAATWARAGVVPEVTEDAESYTGAAFIFLEAATGNNAIIVAPGAGRGYRWRMSRPGPG
jgi:hypothetical protein